MQLWEWLHSNMDDSLNIMYDSIQITSKARQNYSILFIGTVALGKGAETEDSEAGLSFIWLLLTWATQFVET